MDASNDWLVFFVRRHLPVPTCPPLLHIEHGILNCTDDNRRASICHVTCYPGYQANGTSQTECQDNGTWSNKPEMTQCLRNYYNQNTSREINPNMDEDNYVIDKTKILVKP